MQKILFLLLLVYTIKSAPFCENSNIDYVNLNDSYIVNLLNESVTLESKIEFNKFYNLNSSSFCVSINDQNQTWFYGNLEEEEDKLKKITSCSLYISCASLMVVFLISIFKSWSSDNFIHSCYVFTMLMHFVFLLLQRENDSHCQIYNILYYYFKISFILYSNVVSYILCFNKFNNNKNVFLCFYASVLPAIMTIVTYQQFETCATEKYYKIIHTIIPMVVVMFTNWIFFIMLSIKRKFDFKTCFDYSIIMSLWWTMDILYFFNVKLFYIFNVINSLYGVLFVYLLCSNEKHFVNSW